MQNSNDRKINLDHCNLFSVCHHIVMNLNHSSQNHLSSLKTGSHIHLLGICGTAMASLAGLLLKKGFKVTGSDSNAYPPMSTQLEGLGIKIQMPYSADNLKSRPDFIIVGNVISKGNVELQEVLRLDLPYTSLPKAMGEFIIQDRHSIVISGTHGKTTTTSMMSWAAKEQGLKPGFLIGGIPKNFTNSFQDPEGNWFIIEGDEYDTAFFDKVPKFIHYRPTSAILTSVEFDHADIYKNLDEIKSAFLRLLKLIPNHGYFIYNAEDNNIQDLLKSHRPKNSFGYGISVETDYQTKILQSEGEFQTFEVFYKKESLGQFSILMSGRYNALNATSVVALAHQLGWNLKVLQESLHAFLGVKRRQEVLGEPNGVLVIEDFAHHPTAVKETLQGLSQKYPGRPIRAVFEPRSATSRRKIFQKDYAKAFMVAEKIYLAEAFDQSKIDENERFSSAELVQDLQQLNKNANSYSQVENIVSDLKKDSTKGDLIVVMSNGGFDGIYQKLLSALQN